jgi:hypothetical protein
MATLTASVQLTHETDLARFNLIPSRMTLTVDAKFNADRLTVAHASAVAIPLGAVTVPTDLLVVNTNATNFITILDDATPICLVPASSWRFIGVPASADLKAQADTADCVMDFAVFEV